MIGDKQREGFRTRISLTQARLENLVREIDLTERERSCNELPDGGQKQPVYGLAIWS
jgi:hypothetical protein